MQEEMTFRITSHSYAQTQQLGMHLGELLRGGELLLLEGQLGMGKTTFTQGLAQGMGIGGIINSPTFTLLKEYAGRTPQQAADRKRSKASGPALYHFDLYRLEDPEEIVDLGFEDYFSDSSAVCVVEWAERAEGLWPRERLTILLQMLHETERVLTFMAAGSRYHTLLQQFQKSAYATTGS